MKNVVRWASVSAVCIVFLAAIIQFGIVRDSWAANSDSNQELSRKLEKLRAEVEQNLPQLRLALERLLQRVGQNGQGQGQKIDRLIMRIDGLAQRIEILEQKVSRLEQGF